MTSNICRNGGSFFIGSGEEGIYISENDEKIIDIKVRGTALNLVINLNQKNNLKDLLKNLRDNVSPNVKLKASKSSMDLISKSKKN